MMKTTQSILFISSICCLFLAGCSFTSKDNSNSEETMPAPIEAQNEIDVDADITVPERIDGTITLSLGFSTSLEDPRGVASQQFKDEVESRTNGSVIISLYPDSEKGNDNELISGITTGDVDMTVSSAGNFTGYASEIGISALPFLFNNFDEAWKFMDSDISSDIDQSLEEFNIHVLAHFDNGFRCVTTKDKPINTPDDMIGLNIRTPDNVVVMETMSALGAQPKALGFSELYEKLANGEFDAQENPVPIIYNSRFYEVQNCLAITNHSYDAMPFVISSEAWKSLTEEEQAIIQEAAINAQKTDRDMIKQQTEEYIGKLENENMTVTYPDLEPFKEKTQDVKNYFNYDEDLLESVVSIIK